MNARTLAVTSSILLVSQFALADATFQSTTQITGGTLVDALRPMAFLKSTREMLAPITTTTMVHGNQKVVLDRDSTEIIDLDKETITRIDNVKKTYTVVTFAQMRQGMANAAKQMQEAPAQPKQPDQPPPKSDIKMTFDVKVKNTGVTKMVNGLNAQEQIITMTMTATDPNAKPANGPNSASYTVTTDSWIAADPPELKEIADFDLRMGKKMMAGMDYTALLTPRSGGAPNSMFAGMFANNPGAMDGMVQMGKEMAKIQGTHVMDTTSMGAGTGPGATPIASNGEPPPPPPPPPSKSGMLGSALTKGALGRFGIKKNDPAAAPPPAANADPATAAPGSGIMMAMTTQKMNFSSAPVSPSAFQVPAGFKQVPSPYDPANK
jgi:hypothetical protein